MITNNPSTPEFIDRFTKSIAALLRVHKMEEKVFIESQNTEFLDSMRRRLPNAILFMYPAFEFDRGIKVARSMSLFGITIHHERITREEIAIAHKEGFRVTLWGAKSRGETIAAINKSPDYLQTDYLSYTLEILEANQ